jgi:hypothetical protein
MATSPLYYDVAVKSGMNAVTSLLNNGSLRIFTGVQPALDGALTGTLLLTLGFASPAFAAAIASGGTVTAAANAITPGTAGNTGTAGYFALLTSGSAVVMPGSVGMSGCDLNINTTSIPSGASFSINAFNLTSPQN